jgi:hypothetical protein
MFRLFKVDSKNMVIKNNHFSWQSAGGAIVRHHTFLNKPNLVRGSGSNMIMIWEEND